MSSVNTIRSDAINQIHHDLSRMVAIGLYTPLEHVERMDKVKALKTSEVITAMRKTHDEADAYVWDYLVSKSA